MSSLFEGLGDDAVTSIGVLDTDTPVAVILYDLIPLISPDIHFATNRVYKDYYHRKLASLNRAQRLLAISDSARLEAVVRFTSMLAISSISLVRATRHFKY